MVTAGRVHRIRAKNPSPMTLEGTNSYLVLGDGEAIVIDPGPRDDAHIAALIAAADANATKIVAIAVTHGHPDHAPGAALLHERTRAPVYAHVAARFPHDRVLRTGHAIEARNITLRAIEAPGHAHDHLVFADDASRALFTGDVIIGRGTVVIAPPHGDMRAYQATLERLADEFDGRANVIYGGHGPIVDEPAAAIRHYIEHRKGRERELLASLRTGEAVTLPALTRTIYRDVAPVLWPIAARQLLAYLIALEREGRVTKCVLDRPPTREERAILHPDLSNLTDPEARAVAKAELGFESTDTRVEAYALRTSN